MIKIKNSDLNETTSNAFGELLNIDLPISLSWKIAKLAKELDGLIILRKETINELIKKHSEKDKDGNMIAAKDEEGNNIPNTTKIVDPIAYNKELEEFESLENEINFDPIPISTLDEKSDSIKPSILFALSFMFVD
jgi:hypothetical protein